MKITLTNEKELELKLTPLILEYLDDYEGGIEGLASDINADRKLGYAINHFVYSLIASNIDEPLNYREAINLVYFNDIERLAEFVIKNLDMIKGTRDTIKNKHF